METARAAWFRGAAGTGTTVHPRQPRRAAALYVSALLAVILPACTRMSPQRDVHTPDWAKTAVWYQVFVERFRNGDPSNDPTVATLEDPLIPGWELTPWTSDWYAVSDWERARGGFGNTVWHRRYGGDLQGLMDKLDYLQGLGVNALYLNPVFTGRSLHKYDGACLHHIDPNFGPDPDGDRALVAAAHESEDPSTWVWTC